MTAAPLTVPLHVSRDSTPQERGFRFGQKLAKEVQTTVAVYRRMFAEAAGLDARAVAAAGARVVAFLGREEPEILEELQGLAAGADVPLADLAAANARTEILAGLRCAECTTIAVWREPGAAPLTAQTWDWHPDLRRARVVWHIELERGRWLRTFTEAGLVAKIGLNSEGVTLALNVLSSSADGLRERMPMHVLARVVLREANTFDEAVAILRRTPVGASSCFTVSDRSSVAAVEVSPVAVAVLEPETAAVVHTNHFLRLPEGVTDDLLRVAPGSEMRLAEARAQVAGLDPRGAPELLRILSTHGAPRASICCHDDVVDPWSERRATLAAIVLDPVARRLSVTDGQPCRSSIVRARSS